MRLLRAAVVAGTAGAALGLSACGGATSGGPAPAASSADPSVAVTTAAPDPGSAGPASPSAAPTLPAEQCLTGTYALVRFVAVGSDTYGTGQGGDVTVAFADGRYTLAGAGAKPIVVTIGGQTGNLTVDGESKGAYRLKGDTATFADPTTTGRGTLSASTGSGGQKLTMKQVNNVIGLAGDGKVACTAQALTITLASIRLELGRV